MTNVVRDHYGLRRATTDKRRHVGFADGSDEEISGESKKRCQKLNELSAKTNKLRDAMDLNHFMSVSLDRMSRFIANDCSEATVIPGPAPLGALEEGSDDVLGLEREIMQVEHRLRHIHPENKFLQVLLHRVNLAQLTRTPDEVDQDEVDVFYRYHSMSSKSERKRDIGIVCPGWRKGGSANTKFKKGPFTEAHVRQHLTKGDISSPPFISVSESPGKVYKIMQADSKLPYWFLYYFHHITPKAAKNGGRIQVNCTNCRGFAPRETFP